MTDGIKEAEERLFRFLKESNQRVTSERFEILKAALKEEGHFTTDCLYLHMIKSGYKISRAAVYNNIELLVKCKLLAKRNFGGGLFRYESSIGKKDHGHILYEECGRVEEFELPELTEFFEDLSRGQNITIDGYALNLYVICRKRNCGSCGKEHFD